MSVYNGDSPLFFEEALNSVINQELQPSEIVIVNDGPINKSLELIQQKFSDLAPFKVKFLKLKVNNGLGIALQKGISLCDYPWIARMDSDDICRPSRFKLQSEYIRNNNDVDVLGGYIEEFDSKNINEKHPPLDQEGILKMMRYRNPMSHVTIVFRKKAVLDVGSYEHYPFFEDYYLWAKMITKGYKFANIPYILVNVRVGRDMIGRRHGLKYAKYEIDLLDMLYNFKIIKNRVLYLVIITIRVLPRLFPKFVLQFIYKNFLR